MIEAHRIVYNNMDNYEFDLTPHVFFDSDNGATNSFFNREEISTVSYDGSHKYIHGSKYTDSATPRFTLIREDFKDITPDENRRILAWLTGNSKPSWLEIYKDGSNVLAYRYFCIIGNVEQYKLSNGRVVGYEFEIISSAPYAFSRPMTYPSNPDNLTEDQYQYKTIKTSEQTTPFTIECETDEYSKVLYPKITIKYATDNIYFPVNGDKDPTADTTYDMIPNVIYSYGGTYRVNANGERRAVKVISSEGTHDANEYAKTDNALAYFYYFIEDKTIRKIVSTTDKNGAKIYSWEIVGYASAAVQIENKYKLNGEDKRTTTWIAGGVEGETVILDGENKIIYNKTANDRDVVKIIGNQFNLNWLPLAYGTNNITVTGNCAIKFEWVEPRKVGSL